jgi:general secretion pathway protein J
MISSSRQRGFTLIETVVSLLLLAVISVLSYQAVEVVLGTNERSRGDLVEETELQRAWHRGSMLMV